MRWSERQVALLREIGVRLWLPPDAVGAVDAVPRDAEAAAQPDQEEALRLNRSADLRPHRAPDVHDEPANPARATPPAATAAGATSTPASARPDIAGLDWPALRDAVAACTACGLCEGRRQTVFGVGHEQAHWMVVGEAPGEQEDRQGEPFVGKSGQLLDNMLRAVGLTRAAAAPAKQVYIANAIKCRPPGNRNPEPDELATCEPFLVRQVELVRPRIIVAMGRFAVHSLLRSSEPIGRLRGRVHRYLGVPLIVTYHPAYLLRNPQDKAKAWDDLCLAVRTVNGATPP